ncbi:MAG: tetratricopeptide repeat protein [Quisquiliibacterium sp.]
MLALAIGLSLASLPAAVHPQRAKPTVPQAPAGLLPEKSDSGLLAPEAAKNSSSPARASIAADQAMRLMREGKPDDALQVLEVGLKASPRDARLRFLYGVNLTDRGQSAQAAQVFEEMTRDFPELPEPYNNLAVVYAASGEIDKARVALEKAVAALPGYALAHENLGDVYARMALRAYERAAELDPRSDSTRQRLGLARDFLKRALPAAGSPDSR